MTRHTAKLATMRQFRREARIRQKLIWEEFRKLAMTAASQAVDELIDEAGDGGAKAIKLCHIWDRHIDPETFLADVFEAVHDTIQETVNFPYEQLPP